MNKTDRNFDEGFSGFVKKNVFFALTDPLFKLSENCSGSSKNSFLKGSLVFVSKKKNFLSKIFEINCSNFLWNPLRALSF